MHSLRQNTRPFHEWYQEWITHANRSGANDQTKMFAFRRNIHPSLHLKLLGVSPMPTTLARLVELAKEFDQSFRMWTANPTPFHRTTPRIRVSDADDPEPPQINANSQPRKQPSRPQQGGKKFLPLTQEEKDRRRRLNLCSYCGGQNHFADRCPNKRSRPRFSPSRQNVFRVRGVSSNPDNDQPLEEGEIPEPSPTVSRLYHEAASIYDIDIPDPDPDSQDF
jgi:hypothetical protein